MIVNKETGVISINIKITDEERKFLEELSDLITEIACDRGEDWNVIAEEIIDILSDSNEYVTSMTND